MDEDRAAEFTGRAAANPVLGGPLVTDLVTRAEPATSGRGTRSSSGTPR